MTACCDPSTEACDCLRFTALVILIDPPAWPAHGRLWSHLASDSSAEELHRFAAEAGIPRRAFEGDHYDVPEERYHELVAAGAVATSSKVLLAAIVAAGLRRPRRRGEVVLRSRTVQDYYPGAGPCRVDVIRSTLEIPSAATRSGWWLDVRGDTVRLQRGADGWVLPTLVPVASGGWRSPMPVPAGPDGPPEPGPDASHGRLSPPLAPDDSRDRLPSRPAPEDSDGRGLPTLSGGDVAGTPLGYVRVRLLGPPGGEYDGPLPWVFRPVRRPARTGPGAWVPIPEVAEAMAAEDVWPLVERLRAEQTPDSGAR